MHRKFDLSGDLPCVVKLSCAVWFLLETGKSVVRMGRFLHFLSRTGWR